MEARQKLIAEAKPKEVINDAIKGYKARKEARQLKEQKQLKDEKAQLIKGMRERLVAAGLRKDTKTEAEVNAEIKTLLQQKKAGVTLSGALKGHNARKEARKLQELKEEQAQKEKAGKVITKAAQRYQAKKEKKAWEKRTKETLEAEIAALQEEMKAGSRQLREPSTKSKGINKALGSIKDFWLADMSQEEARQARKDARQAKKDAQKEAEDKLSAKAKALQDKRTQLEALGK